MRTKLTPELGCGYVLGVLLAWALAFQYALHKHDAEKRGEAAGDGADGDAYEQVVDALDPPHEGRVVERAPAPEGEAGGDGHAVHARLVLDGIAGGEAVADELGREPGFVAVELDGERPPVDALEDFPVFSVHGDILQ